MATNPNPVNRRNDEVNAAIISRIRYLMTIMHLTQTRFGKMIGMDAANMSKLLSGNITLTERVINRIVVDLGVSKNWLMTGVGVPFEKTGAHPSANMAGAPIYDIDVTAGNTPLSQMFAENRISGYLQLPGIKPEYPLVRVSGNSMTPRIAPGAYAQIRPVDLQAPLHWGAIYVVVTEDYRMVKVLRRNADPTLVTLHSINPDYDDIELPRNQIIALYMVETVINMDVINR